MKYLQHKSVLPIALLAIVVLVVAGYFLFSNSSRDYYMVVEGSSELAKGDPVVIENVPAGRIVSIDIDAAQYPNQVIRFTLPKQYSIPSNSHIQVVPATDTTGIYIRIDVFASKTYFQPGDTVFFAGKRSIKDKVTKTDEAASTGNLVYRVQLMASKEQIPLTSAKFKGIDQIEERIANGDYKYYSGNVSSLEAARKLRAQIIEKGIKDAFVVPFLNDERISIQQALQYEK